ncbi:MAG: signal peptidase II [Pirellulales bacterium]|nr:signal peptidase II [Pirellulales bacterium]
MPAVPRNRWFVFLFLAVGGLTLDLATKHWIFQRLGMPGTHHPIPIVGDILKLETNLNEGALWGMGQGRAALFSCLSMVAVAGIVGWLFWAGNARDWLPTIALGGVCGGVLGNLYDRLGFPGLMWHFPPRRVGEPVYAVRDWIHFEVPQWFDFPVFNIADSLLVGGACLLMLFAFRSERVPQSAIGPATAAH